MFLCTVKVCHTYRVSEKKTPFEIHLYLIQNPFIFSVRDEKNYDLTRRWLVIIICRIHRNHYFSHQARRSCLDFGPTINEFQRELFWGHPVYSRRRPPGRQEVPAMSPNKQKGQKRTKKNKKEQIAAWPPLMPWIVQEMQTNGRWLLFPSYFGFSRHVWLSARQREMVEGE